MKPPRDPRLSVDVRCNNGSDDVLHNATGRRRASADVHCNSRLGRGTSNISDISNNNGVAAAHGVLKEAEDPNIMQSQLGGNRQQDASAAGYHGQLQHSQQQGPLESCALANISENECDGPPIPSGKATRQTSGLLLRPLGFLGDFDEHIPMRWDAQMLALGLVRGTADSSSHINSLAPELAPAAAEMIYTHATSGGGSPNLPGDWAWHSIEASSVVDPVTGKRVRDGWGCAWIVTEGMERAVSKHLRA